MWNSGLLVLFAIVSVSNFVTSSGAQAGDARYCSANVKARSSSLNSEITLGKITAKGWCKNCGDDNNRRKARENIDKCIQAALINEEPLIEASECRDTPRSANKVTSYTFNKSLKKQLEKTVCPELLKLGRYNGKLVGGANVVSDDKVEVVLINTSEGGGCERGGADPKLKNIALVCSADGQNGNIDHSVRKGQIFEAADRRGSEGIKKAREFCKKEFATGLDENSVAFTLNDPKKGNLSLKFDCK